jgi:hypothetical protein
MLDDEEYRRLQIALMLRPEQGPVIPGSGGLRKVRWAVLGAGKRGGLRIIYVVVSPSSAPWIVTARSAAVSRSTA